MTRFGAVVMAYGTPASVDDIEGFYTHIRRGEPPGEAQLADLVARYEAIGGTSPLAERTEAQRVAIAGALEAAAPGDWTVTLGQKHASPFIEDAVGSLAGNGIGDVVGLVLAPHFSRVSIGEYHRRAAEAAAGAGLRYHRVDSWHREPAYVDFLARAVAEARAALPPRHKVLFTAHSLPERALVEDPYPDELRETAAAVADRLAMSPWFDWALAWQSAGRTADAWRGPDVCDVIRDLAATGRADAVCVCPQGFTSDHLEVRYDLDIQAAEVAAEVGLAYGRTRVLNDDPAVMRALAARVVAALDA